MKPGKYADLIRVLLEPLVEDGEIVEFLVGEKSDSVEVTLFRATVGAGIEVPHEEIQALDGDFLINHTADLLAELEEMMIRKRPKLRLIQGGRA